MSNKIFCSLIVVSIALAAASLRAHHSPSAIFDMRTQIAVTGTLTKLEWINPHIVILMEAKGDRGNVDNWKFESNPPSWFRKVGLVRADLAKALGHTITVEGVKARDGSLYGYMTKIKFSDGTLLELILDPSIK